MKIIIITHAPPGSLKGNRVTALRWARLLRESGYQVQIGCSYQGASCDVLIALHARHSFPSIETFYQLHPEKPLIVLLTGTDLYADIQTNSRAARSLEMADALVLLQPLGSEELHPSHQQKARVIYQSAAAVRNPPPKRKRTFDVCVVGHLRDVKDPFRAGLAARLLPAASAIRIIHVGQALADNFEKAALQEMRENPRYSWIGKTPRWQTRKILSASRAMVLSSKTEGGANVISEAVVAGVPVLASRIPGSVGLLGERYTGYFPVGDTETLAALLRKLETDALFLKQLSDSCRALAGKFHPDKEKMVLVDMIKELIASKKAGDRVRFKGE